MARRLLPFFLAWLVCVALGACGPKVAPANAPPVSGPDAAGASDDPRAPVVRVDTGLLRGSPAGATGAGGSFRGIPYAAPPIGDRRWRSPAPPVAWKGVRPATGFGYACMQSPSSHEPKGTPLGSEDCLTLNVFSPDLHPRAPLPVLVFIHGGFFTWGSSSVRVGGTDVYDGASLAARMPAVVVTLNYRLGPLGFVAHPAFAAEPGAGSVGNYGLEDQIAALEWVKRNVTAFGGDPSRVTLSGHSAGAISTVALASAPRARGLFARAIVLSGSGYARPRAQAEELGRELARRVGCETARDVAACLRSRSGPEIIAAMPEAFAEGAGFAPAVDGVLLPVSPVEAFRAKRATPVPMVIGTTSNEFSTMIHTVIKKPIETDADLESALANGRGSPESVRAILAQYPVSSYPSRTDELIAVWSDVTLVCPTRVLARAVSALEPGRVFRFVYAHTYAAPLLHPLGAGHGLELPLVFRNVPAEILLTAAEVTLGDDFTAALARFVRDGDPAAAAYAWPPYDGASDSYVEIDSAGPVTKSGLRAAECDFWEAVWNKRRAER